MHCYNNCSFSPSWISVFWKKQMSSFVQGRTRLYFTLIFFQCAGADDAVTRVNTVLIFASLPQIFVFVGSQVHGGPWTGWRGLEPMTLTNWYICISLPCRRFWPSPRRWTRWWDWGTPGWTGWCSGSACPGPVGIIIKIDQQSTLFFLLSWSTFPLSFRKVGRFSRLRKICTVNE